VRSWGDAAKLTEDEEREARRLAQSINDAAREAAHRYMLARAADEQPLLFPERDAATATQ